MSGQVAQLDPGSCRGGSPPSKIGAKALGGLKGPLMCEKKRKKKDRQKITGANFYAVKEQYRGGRFDQNSQWGEGRYFSLQP